MKGSTMKTIQLQFSRTIRATHLITTCFKFLLAPFVVLYVLWESSFYGRFWNRVDSTGLAVVTGDQQTINWLANASRRAGYQVKVGYEEVEISLRFQWKSRYHFPLKRIQ